MTTPERMRTIRGRVFVVRLLAHALAICAWGPLPVFVIQWTASTFEQVLTRLVVWFVVASCTAHAVHSGVGSAVNRYRDKLIRRSTHGRCGRCGYDITGLQGSTCPECGRPQSS